jgi:uncharacterized protein YndB with AHSA1/START domain
VNTKTRDAEFEITRTFNAPCTLVFKAYSEAERLAQWWGPAGLTWVKSELDFRPGGHFHYCMKAPDGREMWGRFDYIEIADPDQIVFTNAFSDASGAAVRAPFAPDWPLEVMNVVTFSADTENTTTVRLRAWPHKGSEAEYQAFADMRPSLQQGFAGTFDQLSAYLAKTV